MSLVPSRRFPTPRKWIAALAVILSGCGGLGIESPSLGVLAEDGGTQGSMGASEGGGGGGGGGGMHNKPPPDAGAYPSTDAIAPSAYNGSPLCMISKYTPGCDPDLPACIVGDFAKGANLCTSDPALCHDHVRAKVTVPAACRVGPSGPTCALSSSYNTMAIQGAACSDSSECGIGFECIDATCKHYCCDPTTCTAGTSGSGQLQPFCDIESGPGGLLVPVCTTAKSCAPLTDACPLPDMTCTVVNAETAQTACVTFGKAKAGEECLDQKCAANLACIGGTCLQLCDTDHACPGSQKCMPPSAFGALGGDMGLCN